MPIAGSIARLLLSDVAEMKQFLCKYNVNRGKNAFARMKKLLGVAACLIKYLMVFTFFIPLHALLQQLIKNQA